MDKIRVGVIGCGGIFRNLHTPYYHEPTRRADIVAIADLNEDAAKEQASQFGADAYSDYRALLDRNDIDAVDVCCQPGPHKEITLAAAEAGKHILMEKPMCRTIAEGDEMIAAAKKAGVLLQVAYMMRYIPGYQKLKALLDDGTLGTLQMMYSNQLNFFLPEKPWLFVKEEAGGMLVEQAIHHFDLWLWLYGEASSVYGFTSHVPLGGPYPEPEIAVENNAAMIIQFKAGGIGMMIKSWASAMGHRGDGAVCSLGSVEILNHGLRWKINNQPEAEEFNPEPPDDETYRNLLPKQRAQRYWSVAAKGKGIEHWLKCIAKEEKPTTDGRIGRAGIELAEAVYRSSETGKLISLPISP
ncbi:MAG: Gfo/Idh/MocA family oxidoreductase [Candidatus Latescibacteria bacterium]|jgi:predicted dehydrogenase|nr:Gfo/Idh/MocA family oxidoreductase [Candidatus Latescibacterota bacterium]